MTKPNTNSQNLFDFSSYTLTIPNFIFLEAPIGYGKTFFIKELCENTLKEAKVITYPSKSKTSFKSFLAELFQKEFSNIYEYYKVLETSEEKIVFIFDDFHLLQQEVEIIEFITFFLKNQFENLYFILASREKINLPYESIIASNRGLYINQTKLKINLDSLETPLTEEDKLFLTKFDGWALGIFLYLKYKNNELDFKAFQQLVESSINEFINETPLLTSKKAFSLIYELPKFWQELVFKNFITKSSYWFYLSEQNPLYPYQVQEFLKKAFNIAKAEQDNLKCLSILTKLAHSYTLSGDFEEFDKAINKAESFFATGTNTDKIAFLYLKANRLRQLCEHDKTIELVNQILDFECNEISGLNLQTRAKIVLGLTFYQLGNYEETRKAYNQVLLLAKAENNEALSLEVKIMLSFLDVWEGKSDSELSENIITSIEKMPIKTQPLMLLNLIFYWILGEKFELNTGITILEKIKCLNQKLCWSFLKPLINDIEARILRFSKEYDKAIICHKSALECLSKNSFEYLQANLNFALTLVKMNKKEEAKEILEKNIERANQVKAKGILREMQVILEQINPQNSTYKINTTAWIPLVNQTNELKKVTTEKESLKITLFDGLKITLGDRKIDKWSRKKSKNVLICLLLKPNGIHRETLADLVFFTDELDNPLKNLDVSIHSLRKALEPERKVKESSFILFKDSCYIFNWANPHTLDLNDFELNHKVWKKSLTSNLTEAISTSTKALELYQGALLPEIDFAELWIEEKEDTKRKALAMSNFLTEHYLKENDFELAETYANKAIFIDNLAEETYIALMKIAEKKKDSTSLKNTYERMLYTFKKEFDDLPSPETILTYKTILQKICK